MESKKIKHLLDHKEEIYLRYQTKNGILLMIRIMDSIQKVILMIIQLK